MRVAPDELFTAVALALGPSPREADSMARTAYQLNVIRFCGNAGVSKLDDPEFRRILLTWYFTWETLQEKTIDTHSVGG